MIGADVALFASGLDDHRFPAFGYSQEQQVDQPNACASCATPA